MQCYQSYLLNHGLSHQLRYSKHLNHVWLARSQPVVTDLATPDQGYSNYLFGGLHGCSGRLNVPHLHI